MMQLSGSEKKIVAVPTDSCMVAEGSVLVFLLYGDPVRMLFLAQLKAGDPVPCVEGQRFLLAPANEAKLTGAQGSPAELRKFAAEIGVELPENDSEVSAALTGKLTEIAQQESIREQEEIRNRIRERSELEEENRRRMFRSLRDDAEETGRKQGNALYDALRVLFRRQGIALVSFETLQKACPEGYTVFDAARLSGTTCREVTLPKNLRKTELDPLLCFLRDSGKPIVVFSDTFGRKRVFDPVTQEAERFPAELEKQLEDKAYEIQKCFAEKSVNFRSMTRFALREMSLKNLVITLIGMFLVTEAGLLLATLNSLLYDSIIPQGEMTDLIGFAGIIIACMIGSLCFGISKNIATFRNTSKVSYSLQSAILNRLFHMPEKFFRSYESALLSYRVERLSGVYISMYMCLIQIVLQGGFSLLYCRRMYEYSPALARVGLLFVLLNVITSAVIGQVFNEYSTDKSRARGQLRTFLYQTVTGISGVRLLGAEEDVQGEYVDKFVDYINADRKYSLSQRLAPVVSILITGVSTVLMYSMMVNARINVSIGSFMGFMAAYAAFSASMAMVGNNAMSIYSSLPTLQESADVLRMQPEQYGSGKILKKVTGKIDIDRVSFSYQKDGKQVLRNIDLHIKPGEYVAITGRSGCGKSTLLRLLLGFEQPSSGMIYYDDIGMDRLNIPELRRRMGVVLQDGGLISGTILDNIKAGNRDLTNEELDRILDEVGLKEDINALQMGILTPISEEWSTISGGQKQRILIARAIAGNPDILLMDEATSSLDNITQKYVCESLEKHNITRIVIAHRLSTVVNCDRIIVMDNGQIREQGTYEELMAQKGVFYQLAVDQT